MKKITYLISFAIITVSLSSCLVSKKKFDEQEALAKKSMAEKRDCNEKLDKANADIANLNDVFYHIVDASDNSPADLSIFSDQIADGPWASIGVWTGTPAQWANMQQVVATPGQAGSGRIKFTKSAWTPAVNDSVFALIDTIPIKRDFTFPTAFLPGGVGVPVENTYFTIINQGDIVMLDELSVFNRWGEMVFDSRRDGTDKWDGQYHGKLQDQGNYVYLAKVRNKQTNKLYPTVTGNVALIW